MYCTIYMLMAPNFASSAFTFIPELQTLRSRYLLGWLHLIN